MKQHRWGQEYNTFLNSNKVQRFPMHPVGTPIFLNAWPATPPLALLVDRDADTRRMYAEYLTFSACEIEQAEDGREALAKALTRRPDIVITETRLPGIDGFELCRLLRTDPVTQKTPIVLVTGDAFEGQVRRGEMAGADAVLIKPCLPEHLVNEMRRLLTQSSELRERGRQIRERLSTQLTKSAELHERSQRASARVMLSRAHKRVDTTMPPSPAPTLRCPRCDGPLRYTRSHVGGVSAKNAEQWDYFECGAGCGAFQYRQRTRKVRQV
jgi:two-component system cell cycle response regulator DivK